MRVLVWGLGYVGTVSAACLSELGHDVIGVETNRAKVESLNAGVSAIREPGLDALVKKAVLSRKLRAVYEGESCVQDTDVSLVCVGTPSTVEGGPTLDFLRNVARDIGRGLKHAKHQHVV